MYSQQSDDVLYYNFQYTNSSSTPIEIRLTDSRSSYFLQNPSEYVMAVDRFQISNNAVPIMRWPGLNGVADNTKYYVSIKDAGGVITTTPLIFTASDPKNTLTIFTIQRFLDILNTAILTACTARAVARSAYFVFNKDSGIIDGVFPTADFGVGGATLYMNSLLYTFFDNFNVYYDPSLTNYEYEFLVKPTGNNVITATTPPTGFGAVGAGLWMYGEFQNLGQLYSLRKIIFTTANIPIVGEFIPSSVTNRTNGQSTTSAKYITDFEMHLEGADARTARGIQTFNNSGEYRLIELLGNSPLKTIDIQVFWVDNNGVQEPFLLTEGSYFSLKIMFRKKSLKKGF